MSPTTPESFVRPRAEAACRRADRRLERCDALENGATEIWTHDAAFVRVPGLHVVDPLA